MLVVVVVEDSECRRVCMRDYRSRLSDHDQCNDCNTRHCILIVLNNIICFGYDGQNAFISIFDLLPS